MSRPLVLSTTLALTALAAGGLWLAVRASSGAGPVPAAAPPATLPGASDPAGPVVSRPGRRLPLDDAIRELNLIRPSPPKAAPEFTVPIREGQRFRLSEHRGKVVLVNFWATWCPPCREEMPSMERLWRQHRQRGFLLLAVSLDADPKLVGPFVAEHGLTFLVATDPGVEVANLYGVRALPATFVVDRRGNLAALALGPRTWDNDAAHSLVEGLAR
jgi:peroxiredoxin